MLPKNKLIDLSADFRLRSKDNYKKFYKAKHLAPENINKSIYALPEIKKNKVKKFKNISCPGCYPTTILLPLLPLLKKFNKIKKYNYRTLNLDIQVLEEEYIKNLKIKIYMNH